jgi:hypothetical protein
LLIELGRIDFRQDLVGLHAIADVHQAPFKKDRLLLAPPDAQNLSVRIPQRLD